jgi:hypothetical protein
MSSITLKFSYKFKKYLAICNNVFRHIEKIQQNEHKELMSLLEKYKLFYIYKHFFVDNPDKHLKLPKYKIKNHITLYKQKTIDINEFSTLPFYHNTQEKAIYYVYADNPVNWSLSIHNSIKNIKNEGNIDNKPTHSLIRDLLLTPTEDLQYQLMFLDKIQEENMFNSLPHKDKNHKKTNINILNKIITFSNDKFISLFVKYELYKLLKVKCNNCCKYINNKYKNDEYNEELEIILGDLNNKFYIDCDNENDLIYKIIIAWCYIIKKYFIHRNNLFEIYELWTDLIDKIDEIFHNKEETEQMIKKVKSEIKTLDSLLTVSHTVS